MTERPRSHRRLAMTTGTWGILSGEPGILFKECPHFEIPSGRGGGAGTCGLRGGDFAHGLMEGPPAESSRWLALCAVSTSRPSLGNENSRNHGKHGLHGKANILVSFPFRVFRVFRGSQTQVFQAYPSLVKVNQAPASQETGPMSIAGGEHLIGLSTQKLTKK